MKRMLGLFILLSCMFSFTGFSSTTDLPENSTVTVADFDVGPVTLVDTKYQVKVLNAVILDVSYITPYFFFEFDDSRIYSKQNSKEQSYSENIEQPPGNYMIDFKLYNARGSLQS